MGGGKALLSLCIIEDYPYASAQTAARLVRFSDSDHGTGFFYVTDHNHFSVSSKYQMDFRISDRYSAGCAALIRPAYSSWLGGKFKGVPTDDLTNIQGLAVYHRYMPYGSICHMAARLIFRDKYVYADGAIREMVIWRLPNADKERRHGLKYRLYYGYPGQCLVRYDNERGKGDHRHAGDQEHPYTFVSVERLIEDFRADIARLRGKNDE